jgi:hypothetical protein
MCSKIYTEQHIYIFIQAPIKQSTKSQFTTKMFDSRKEFLARLGLAEMNLKLITLNYSLGRFVAMRYTDIVSK